MVCRAAPQGLGQNYTCTPTRAPTPSRILRAKEHLHALMDTVQRKFCVQFVYYYLWSGHPLKLIVASAGRSRAVNCDSRPRTIHRININFMRSFRERKHKGMELYRTVYQSVARVAIGLIRRYHESETLKYHCHDHH